ncbi:unnamed protein product [Cylicostephanus goldi]|uniref:Uncharacterized protein n=1 Tax=Cylicostephanus goldi TaxID=71465 RepID=A0A3P6Q632_CYLGO|nr:unnamed protein product [Cylicostephanus goldi]
MVSTHDAEAIGSLQLSPVESSLAGTVQENEGRISRNSQSPDIIMIKEVVKAADKISIPTVSHQQPVSVCDDSINRGQTVISRSDAEQLSSGNECKPKSYTRTARKARLRRWAETEQQRKDRLAREAKRARLKRLAETEDQKRARLAKAAENAKMWRSRAREQKAEDVAIRKS